MGKSLRNAVAPDDIYRDYGADTLRLYEMFMGPLDKERPWSTADIVGVHRFLQRLWRNFVDEDDRRFTRRRRSPPTTTRADCCTAPSTRCGTDMAAMSFNTAIARLFELNNHLTTLLQERRRTAARGRGPHGVDGRASRPARCRGVVGAARPRRHDHLRDFPTADAQWLVEDLVEVPVQINSKVRARVEVAVGADAAAHEAAARAEPRIAEMLKGATVPHGQSRPRQDRELRPRLTISPSDFPERFKPGGTGAVT